MKIYQVHPRLPFLETIADFIIKEFKNLYDVQVILPNKTSLRFLQEIFISKSKAEALFLPNFLTIYDPLSPYLDQCTLATNFEQCLIMARHIKEIQKHSLESAFKLSQTLLPVYEEFKLHGFDPSKIKSIPGIEFTEHIEDLTNFISRVYSNLDDELSKSMKLDRITFIRNNLTKNLSSTSSVVCIGILGNNNIELELAKLLGNRDSYLILPPLEAPTSETSKLFLENSDPASVYHNLNLLLETLGYPLDKIQHFDGIITDEQHNMFSPLLLANTKAHIEPPHDHKESNKHISNITIIETTSYFEEAAAISLIVNNIVLADKDATLGIVSNNAKLLKQVRIFLMKYSINIDNSSKKLSTSKVYQFLASLLEVLSSSLSFKSQIELLKHPLMECPFIYELEKYCIKSKSFDFSEFAAGNTWYINFLCNIKSFDASIIGYSNILHSLLMIAEKIAPKIFDYEEGNEIFSLLSQHADDGARLNFIGLDEFIPIFSHSTKNITLKSNSWTPKIRLMEPEEIVFSPNIDYVILADINEGSWPNEKLQCCLLSNQMRANLGFDINYITTHKNYNYYFYLCLHKKNVYITRSIRLAEGTQTSSAKILLKLQHMFKLQSRFKDKLKFAECARLLLLPDSKAQAEKHNDKYNNAYLEVSAYAGRSDFPSVLSVSNIELLMRNPYGFYASKILKLKKLEQLYQELGVSDFGNFIHQAIDIYTKNYSDLPTDKLQGLLQIGESILTKLESAGFNIHLWRPRFYNIAPLFVSYDSTARRNARAIYSEVEGQFNINILDKVFTLFARADRIEEYEDKINIVDFKTGAVPSQGEVEQGLSPQLILEHIIAANQGFKFLNSNNNISKSIELTYVKLSASSLTSIMVDTKEETIKEAYNGLERLLEFFLQDPAIFLSCPNPKIMPKYNDYDHLARLISID